MSRLSEYQVEGIKWMMQREKSKIPGGVQSDEVGLGKTIMTIETMNRNQKPKTLIIAPKSLVPQWKYELNKWSNINNTDIKELEKDSNESRVVIASVSNFTKENTIYHKIIWDRIVLDEAHVIKNKRSKTHISISSLQSTIKWALTATPVLNKMTDFWSIMKWIGADMEEVYTKKEDIVNTFFIRRTQDKLNLPGYDMHIIKSKLYHEEKQIYNKVLDSLLKKLKHNNYDSDDSDEDESKTSINRSMNKLYILEKLMRLIQICVHPQLFYKAMSKKHKTDNLEWKYRSSKLESLLKLLDPNIKTIIFCKFVDEMKMYKSLFPNSLLLHGSMKQEQREETLACFKRKDVPFLFIQEKVGSCGLNLQNAKRVIFTTPNWSPALEHQAIGRANRRGQTDKVQVYKLITENSIEEHIIKIQEKKQDVFQSLWDQYRAT